MGNNPQNNDDIESFEIDGNMENRKNQTPTPWAEQFSILKRNNQINRNKPIYKNPQPHGHSAGDIALEALKGFGQGVIGGIEHGTNATSMGLYDGAHDLLGTGTDEKRQKELEKFDHQYMNLFTKQPKNK